MDWLPYLVSPFTILNFNFVFISLLCDYCLVYIVYIVVLYIHHFENILSECMLFCIFICPVCIIHLCIIYYYSTRQYLKDSSIIYLYIYMCMHLHMYICIYMYSVQCTGTRYCMYLCTMCTFNNLLVIIIK